MALGARAVEVDGEVRVAGRARQAAQAVGADDAQRRVRQRDERLEGGRGDQADLAVRAGERAQGRDGDEQVPEPERAQRDDRAAVAPGRAAAAGGA